MDRGAWQAAVQGVAKNQTQLSSYTITTTMISRASILWALGMCPTEGTLYSGSVSAMPPAKGTQHAVRRMGALGKQPLPNWSHQEGCVLLAGEPRSGHHGLWTANFVSQRQKFRCKIIVQISQGGSVTKPTVKFTFSQRYLRARPQN